MTSKDDRDESLIPNGQYCYTIVSVDENTGKIQTKICPYWSIRDGKPEQDNGYCDYLGWGDWDIDGLTMLWDQVKECWVKMDDLNDKENKDGTE